MMRYIRSLIKRNGAIHKWVINVYNFFPFNNHFKLRENKFQIGNSLLRACSTKVDGVCNSIIIGNRCHLSNCSFLIHGNKNTIVLSDFISARNVEFFIEDDNNLIEVKEHTSFCGKTQLACIEGCTISIGENCLLSSDISFRTGDSHSIINMDGVRINPSRDITIGNHVWIGHKVSINKGALVADDSIVGTGAIVTRCFEQPNIIIAGVPAKIIKKDTNWKFERTQMPGENI